MLGDNALSNIYLSVSVPIPSSLRHRLSHQRHPSAHVAKAPNNVFRVASSSVRSREDALPAVRQRCASCLPQPARKQHFWGSISRSYRIVSSTISCDGKQTRYGFPHTHHDSRKSPSVQVQPTREGLVPRRTLYNEKKLPNRPSEPDT